MKFKDFEKIDCLPIHERVSQCSLRSVYIFFSKNCPTILMRYMFLYKLGEFTRVHHTKN